MIIAIDGPSGAGKSTVAKRLAEVLNIAYLDTGAMYRAIGLKAFRHQLSRFEGLEDLLDSTMLDIVYENGSQKVLLDGEDVSEAIRQHFVSKLASDVSALPFVRIKMVDMQRKIAASKDTVLDGRDIGTFVLPNAEYKYYLTASVEKRAERRYKELLSNGQAADIKGIEEDIRQRDYNDINRAFAPLRRADDAVLIDSTDMNIEQVVNFILNDVLPQRH